jgi:hypothetical protein
LIKFLAVDDLKMLNLYADLAGTLRAGRCYAHGGKKTEGNTDWHKELGISKVIV